MLTRQQPNRREQEGQTLMGRRRAVRKLTSVFMSRTLQPGVSTQPWEPGCQTTYFKYISLKTSTSDLKSPKPSLTAMEWNGT